MTYLVVDADATLFFLFLFFPTVGNFRILAFTIPVYFFQSFSSSVLISLCLTYLMAALYHLSLPFFIMRVFFTFPNLMATLLFLSLSSAYFPACFIFHFVKICMASRVML